MNQLANTARMPVSFQRQVSGRANQIARMRNWFHARPIRKEFLDCIRQEEWGQEQLHEYVKDALKQGAFVGSIWRALARNPHLKELGREAGFGAVVAAVAEVKGPEKGFWALNYAAGKAAWDKSQDVFLETVKVLGEESGELIRTVQRKSRLFVQEMLELARKEGDTEIANLVESFRRE